MQKNISLHYFNLVVLLIAVFTAVFIFDTTLYDSLSREDSIIEYLSALFLLLSSLFLWRYSSYAKSRKIVNYKWIVLLLSFTAILFFLAAGEEISWGQRIFNIPTPEYLSSINGQQELNFHNINKKFFDRVLDRVNIIFVIVSTVLLILKKDTILEIKTPNIFIICAFSIVPFYTQKSHLDFYHITYLPLIGILFFALVYKNKTHLYVIITTLIITFLIPTIHTKYYHLFPSHNNSANEYKEFLFCLCCLAYSYVINTHRKLGTKGRCQV